jgi:hypothetical protein
VGGALWGLGWKGLVWGLVWRLAWGVVRERGWGVVVGSYSRWGVRAVVRKNWEPLVFGPALAIDKRKGSA